MPLTEEQYMKELRKQMTEWRHDLHAHPESAFEEVNTAAFVAEKLEEMGIQVETGIGKTGVVGTLKVGDGERVVGLRADMDCICLQEASDLPYGSQTPNRMHACGHDGHMATLLGAAKILSESRDFSGTVRFVFQPAEEPGWGSKAMIEDGFFERFPVDEMYGLHNMPQYPAGTIAVREGGIMASEDNFTIKIKGKGGHASAPDVVKDPLVTAAEIICALQTIVARNVTPTETAVVSCTELETDGAHNAIPSNVVIRGDTKFHPGGVQADRGADGVHLPAHLPDERGGMGVYLHPRICPHLQLEGKCGVRGESGKSGCGRGEGGGKLRAPDELRGFRQVHPDGAGLFCLSWKQERGRGIPAPSQLPV